MIRNGMWDVLSLPDPRNKENKWDLLIHNYRFPLEYVKLHVKSFQKGSESDKYRGSEPDVVRSIPEEYFVK